MHVYKEKAGNLGGSDRKEKKQGHRIIKFQQRIYFSQEAFKIPKLRGGASDLRGGGWAATKKNRALKAN